MKTEFYEEFVQLAETGSFSKTAEQFSFTQVALTQHIQQMEDIIGVRLFERSTRKIELNEYGKIILPYARRIIKLKEEAISAVSQQIMHKHFNLSIGFYPAASRLNFVDKLNEFQELHPDISVECRELLPEALMEAMDHGEFDFILMEEIDNDVKKSNDGYDRLCMNRDTLAAVVPDTHPLAGYGEALLTQFSKERFFMMPEHSFVCKLGIAACKKRGFLPAITYTSYSITNIMDMIVKNKGISLLMKTPAQKHEKSGISVVDLIPAIYSSINLLFHEDDLNEYGKVFLDFMSLNKEP